MKQFFALIFFLLFNCITSLAQHNFGIKLNGGLSRISSNETDYYSKLDVKFAFSGHGGVFYTTGNKTFFGIELLFIPVAGKVHQGFSFHDTLGNLLNFNDDVHRHIYYLGFPFYFGFDLNKINLTLGGQAAYALSSGYTEKATLSENGSETLLESQSGKLYIKKMDYGFRGSLSYDLTEKISIEALYYHGLNNILKGYPYNFNAWDWKIQQATIGIRYKLITSAQFEEKPVLPAENK